MDELSNLQNRLLNFKESLCGHNYVVDFEMKKLSNSTNTHEAIEELNKLFDRDFNPNQELKNCSYENFIKEVSKSLNYRGDYGSGVKLTKEEELKFKIKLEEFIKLLKNKFNPSKTKIYFHKSIYTWIFWGFTFLIVSKEKQATYLFEGSSSD